jgi:hypothetical protein
MRAACRSGLVGAVILCIVALASDSTMLLAIALFGGIVCYTTVRQVDHERDMLGFEADPSELAAFEEELAAEREPEVRAARPAPRDAKRAVDADAEIDAILDKIARLGIGSLTASEREVLARETERKRDGGKGDRRS